LIHRGPDDAGEWWSEDGRVGLAHRRLSILDLSPLGHQPMHLTDRGLSIVFNGEIYNHAELRKELQCRGHKFRSHCDTEVLLAAYAQWGADCLARLNGMFAFALYDALEGRLLLARDRAGEKPLFYRLQGQTLVFASELKALLAQPHMPRRIDPESLDCYLAFGYVPGQRCILSGYHKLPPGHALSYDLRQGLAKVWRYWELPEFDPAASADEATLLDELDALLDDAVRLQLRADVPVGILLSGGVDSSLVTAMAVRHSRQVHTFSVGFPGGGEFDETDHARLIARHFGTKHTELMAEPISVTTELIAQLVRQFDEPMVDSSMIPTYLVSRLVREHCTVALGGDGGDELFGGYGRYSRLLLMQRYLMFLPAMVRKSLARGAEHRLPVGFKGRNYLQALDVDLMRGDLPLIPVHFDVTTRRHLMRRHAPWATTAEHVWRARTPPEPDSLQRATRMDFASYLAEDILVKVDRVSMLNSLEVRAPMLDHRLIEFAFSRVPSLLKTTTKQKKILLKRLTERLLPAEFDRQRKQGFAIPYASWLRGGPFRDLFWDVLSSPDSLFDRQTVQGLLRGQDRGFNNGERLFALVQFELWRQAYATHL
jgi:asparagine synthase (glutamine-hydrolysing)